MPVWRSGRLRLRSREMDLLSSALAASLPGGVGTHAERSRSRSDAGRNDAWSLIRAPRIITPAPAREPPEEMAPAATEQRCHERSQYALPCPHQAAETLQALDEAGGNNVLTLPDHIPLQFVLQYRLAQQHPLRALKFLDVVAHTKPQRGEGKDGRLLIESHGEISLG